MLAHRLRGSWALSLALLALSQAARADDILELQGLLNEQIVTSASKQAEGASSAPALSTNLSADDLRKYGITTLAEAIDFLALGVATSEDLNGGEIGARGVLLKGDRGSHFLFLVDGHAMNEPVRGSAWFGVGAGVPLELIDHVEVIVGPGSVLYGSNAMLGLINVVTKRAKDDSGTRLIVESALPTSVRVAGGTGQRFSLGGKSAEVTAQLQYFKQVGPSLFFAAENTGIDQFTGQPGRNTRASPGTGIWGGAEAKNSLYAEAPAGIVRFAMGNTEVDLRASYYRHASPTGGGNFDEADTADRERRASIDIKQRHVFSTLAKISARLYADYYDLDSAFIASRGSLCPFGTTTCDYASGSKGLWGGLDLQSSWDWSRTGRFVTIAGIEVRQRKIDTSSNYTNIDTGRALYPAAPALHVNDTTLGAYIQQTWNVHRALRLNGGVRADRDPRFDIVLNPRVAASLSIWTGGTVKAAYAEAFRAPSWDESDNTGARRIAAQSLNSEKVRSVETSFQQQAGPHRMTVGAFYSDWSNLVELRALSQAEAIQAIRDGKTSVPFTPGVQLSQYRNVASITNYGVNSGIEGALWDERAQYGVTVTVATADEVVDGVKRRLPVAPRLFGNARVSYAAGGHIPTVALVARFMGERAADHAFDGNFRPTPMAPATVELRLSLTGTVPGISALSYRAIADYVTANRGPYVVGPVTTALSSQATAQLIPVDRFRTTVGLEYTF